MISSSKRLRLQDDSSQLAIKDEKTTEDALYLKVMDQNGYIYLAGLNNVLKLFHCCYYFIIIF